MTHRTFDLNWTLPTPGETVAGKYIVEKPLGRGGLAVVLSALHAELDRRVALKILLPEWAGDADVTERFLREGRAATRIQSEHVVRVFDVGTLPSGLPYLVLECLDGQNLDEVLTTRGPVPVATAIDWILQAGEALAEAHALGIIHRDLKPANLFLTHAPDGTPCIKVIDFGLSKVSRGGSKLTRPTDIMGSPAYMAPEQLRAACDADSRTDVWALGAVLHELVAGRPPFAGESMPEICAGVLTAPPERISSACPAIPAAVEAAILRCLTKDPNGRFASVAEVARALAPYGTPAAQASCARIERIGGTTAGMDVSLLSLPPMEPVSDPWPSRPAVSKRLPGNAPSGRVLVGSLLVMTGIGTAAFMGVYQSVHGHEPRSGVREVQAVERLPVPASPVGSPIGSSSASAGPIRSTSVDLPTTEGPPATAPHPVAPIPVEPAASPPPAASAGPVAVTPEAPGRSRIRSRPRLTPAAAPVSTPASIPRPDGKEPSRRSAAEPPPTSELPIPPAPIPQGSSGAEAPPTRPEDLFDGRK